jgi:hypothetical protein
MDFDANLNTVSPVVRWVIENNRFNEVEFYDCTQGPTCPLQQ